MASESFIGAVQATVTAPAPPAGVIASFIGVISAVFTAPSGPYGASLISGVKATFTAPPVPVRPIFVKNAGSWDRALISVYNDATDSWI